MAQQYYVEPEYWIDDYAVGDPTSAAAQINITSETGTVTGTFLFAMSATSAATATTALHALRSQVGSLTANIASSTSSSAIRIRRVVVDVASEAYAAASIGVTRSASQVINAVSSVSARVNRVMSQAVSTISGLVTSVFSAREKWEPTQANDEVWAEQSLSDSIWVEQKPTD